MWIAITLGAAMAQVARTSLQHRLRDVLSTNAAGFVRYAYAAPLAIALSLVWFGVAGHSLPQVNLSFWWIVTVAGVAQICGTVALLAAFRARSFAIGTVYSKFQVIAAAIIGLIALGDQLSVWGWLGMLLSTAGVAALAARGSLKNSIPRNGAGDKAAVLGIVAGVMMAIAAVGIRAGTQQLTGGTSWDRALITLTCMLSIQLVINAVYLSFSDRPGLVAAWSNWRAAAPVGVFSMIGSAGWAWAMALESAAKVFALAQVEVVFAFIVSRVALHERHTRAEYLASALVVLGVFAMVILG